MDLKALIAKMDQIEAKQILNESSMHDSREIDIDDVDQEEPIKNKPVVDAKGRTREEWLKLVTTKFPTAKIMHAKTPNGPIIALLGDGRRVMWRKAEQEDTIPSNRIEGFTSSIANALLVEFGLTEAGEWTPTPEQEKWLGGANRQDPLIINRMPGAKPPSSYFTDPADQAKAKQMGFDKPAGGAATKPAAAPAAPTGTTAQGDDAGNTTITKPDGTVQVVGPDGNVIPPGGGKETPVATATPVADPGKITTTNLPAAAGAATKPAAGGDAARPGMRPGGTAAVYDQQKALVAQGAKIATDGIMGPQTQAAIKQFGGAKPAAPAAGATKPAADASDATIDPAKLKRFKELLAKSGAK